MKIVRSVIEALLCSCRPFWDLLVGNKEESKGVCSRCKERVPASEFSNHVMKCISGIKN